MSCVEISGDKSFGESRAELQSKPVAGRVPKLRKTAPIAASDDTPS
jgi:hypothetical protein